MNTDELVQGIYEELEARTSMPTHIYIRDFIMLALRGIGASVALAPEQETIEPVSPDDTVPSLPSKRR